MKKTFRSSRAGGSSVDSNEKPEIQLSPTPTDDPADPLNWSVFRPLHTQVTNTSMQAAEAQSLSLQHYAGNQRERADTLRLVSLFKSLFWLP